MKICLLITAAVSAFALNSFADTGSWTHHAENFFVTDATDFGGHVYYNCNSVESFTQSFLEDMGATNVEVTCTGGIDDVTPYALPASVEVEFDALSSKVTSPDKLVRTRLQGVQLTGWDNCLLAQDVFEHVKDHFEISDLTTSSFCTANDHYNYSFKTLFPAN